MSKSAGSRLIWWFRPYERQSVAVVLVAKAKHAQSSVVDQHNLSDEERDNQQRNMFGETTRWTVR